MTGAYVDHGAGDPDDEEAGAIWLVSFAAGLRGRIELGGSTHEAFCPNIWQDAQWALGDHSKQMTDDRLTKSTAPSTQQFA